MIAKQKEYTCLKHGYLETAIFRLVADFKFIKFDNIYCMMCVNEMLQKFCCEAEEIK